MPSYLDRFLLFSRRDAIDAKVLWKRCFGRLDCDLGNWSVSGNQFGGAVTPEVHGDIVNKRGWRGMLRTDNCGDYNRN